MIRLYHGDAAQDFELLHQPLSADEWTRLRQTTCRLLRARQATRSAELLENISFELYDATNGFGDEFSVLFSTVPFEQYVELAKHHSELSYKHASKQIAETVSEIRPDIRFIAIEVDTSAGPEAVAPPAPQITSDIVERALADAQQLIRTQGATSGVDRVHTAFYGYLLAVANKQGIDVPDDVSLTALFRAGRE
jgi:hypothetical protein